MLRQRVCTGSSAFLSACLVVPQPRALHSMSALVDCVYAYNCLVSRTETGSARGVVLV